VSLRKGNSIVARWQLLKPHYLNVEFIYDAYGNEIECVYEYAELNGARKRFPVPVLLEVEGRNRQTGETEQKVVVVSNGNGAEPGDYIHHGDPTPDMTPLDAEAEEISARFAAKWFGRPDDALLAPPAPSSVSADIEALKSQVAALTAELAERRDTKPTEPAQRRM
jgi:hypothetical protein